MRRRRAIAIALCLACVVAEELHAQLRLRTLASGFTTPLAVVQDPADRNTQFVVQQNGRIRVVQLGAVLATDFLDVSSSIVAGGEQGLLGFAFPPDTATSGRFFINFTNRSGDTVVARFRRASPIAADTGSRFDLRWGNATAQRLSRSRMQITTAVIWHSGPMASSTSALATAVRPTIRRIARRTRRSFSARCCAS